MDYYQLLRVSTHASSKDIEDAYQRLIKESRYDSSIDLRTVAAAYRILSDPKQKAAYDTLVKTKGAQEIAYSSTLARKKKVKVERKLTTKQLVIMLVVLLVVTAAYYVFRFGYVMNDFTVGDDIYLEENHQRVGTILKYETIHNFGNFRESAYLVHTDHGDIWYSAAQVKMRCYAKKNDPSS